METRRQKTVMTVSHREHSISNSLFSPNCLLSLDLYIQGGHKIYNLMREMLISLRHCGVCLVKSQLTNQVQYAL